MGSLTDPSQNRLLCPQGCVTSAQLWQLDVLLQEAQTRRFDGKCITQELRQRCCGVSWPCLGPPEPPGPLPSVRELQCLSLAQEDIKCDGCPEIIISGKHSLISVCLAGFYCLPFLQPHSALVLSLNSCHLLSTRVLPPTPFGCCYSSAAREALCRACDPQPMDCTLRGRGGAFETRLDCIRGWFYCFVGLWEQRGRWLLAEGR